MKIGAVLLSVGCLYLASCQQAKQKPSSEPTRVEAPEPRTAATIDKFIDLCVKNISDLDRVEGIAKAEGWKPTPGSEIYFVGQFEANGPFYRYLSFDIPETSAMIATKLSLSNLSVKHTDAGPKQIAKKSMQQCHFDFVGSTEITQNKIKEAIQLSHEITIQDEPPLAFPWITILHLAQSYRGQIEGIPVRVVISAGYVSYSQDLTKGKTLEFESDRKLKIPVNEEVQFKGNSAINLQIIVQNTQ